MSAWERSGGVSIRDIAIVRSTRASSRAFDMSSCGHRMIWSSVSYCRVSQFGHRPSIELSRSCICLRVAVHLCCSLTILVWLCFGRRLFVRRNAFHAIELNICLFHDGCFASMRSLNGASVAMNRMHVV